LQENDQLLDGGELGNERKLYYRELIARFSHHVRHFEQNWCSINVLFSQFCY